MNVGRIDRDSGKSKKTRTIPIIVWLLRIIWCPSRALKLFIRELRLTYRF